MVQAPPRRRRSILRGLVGAWVVLGTLGGAVAGWLYHEHVVAHPGEQLSRSYVRSVIAQESPVFYRDGVTRVGVFFDDEHRTYVGWDELPLGYVVAIVAAEDDRFWGHPGFDLWHIARAMRDNLSAGRLVAGGSTLTQQTAKNLYYRPDRSLRSKLLEGLNALRLEAHYDKSEILTFYANQFHVSGNGRGLGIGARYFFDKDVDQLTLAESAFLAGLVKAPSRYDPFLGDPARRERAIAAGHERTTYVLRRIVEESADKLAGPYPVRGDAEGQAAYAARTAQVRQLQVAAQALLDQGVSLSFKRGAFRYASSAVLDEVARRLAEPPFDEVLQAAGIEDPATAGLQVITTLDPVVQRAATYGLWHHLTDVGVMLEGSDASIFARDDSDGPRFDPDAVPEAGTFRLARITDIVDVQGRKHLEVDLGGHGCTVDRDGVVRAAVAVQRAAAGDPNAKIPGEGVNAFVDALGQGRVVWVSVREVGEQGALCDLEVRPELQGAAMVLHHGQVLAMVGGNDNMNFNRATALRQMGSTWKPLVFHAALELGWSPIDVLDNRPGVFPFSTTFYWPTADHASTDEVSMAWAGVRSENLASVWLMYHLTDRLDHQATASLAESVGLARGPDETPEAYRSRIQKAGVLPLPSRRREATFLRSRAEVLAALPESRADDASAVRSMLYGFGFDAERRRTQGWKAEVLDRSWLATEARLQVCLDTYRVASELLEAGILPPASGSPLSFHRDERWIGVACGTPPGEGWGPAEPDMFERGGFFAPRPELVDAREMWIDGRLRAGTVLDLAEAMERRELVEALEDDTADLYAPERLYWHQDFRVLLGMRYLVQLAERMGVRTEVREVLSLPLGASEITLEEAAMVYAGLVSGKTWRFEGETRTEGGVQHVPEPLASTLLIAEIRDVDGRVLYRATPTEVLVTSEASGAMTTDILANVITHGTGARARDVVKVGGAPIPLAGKTGTTNDFRNAAFLGVVPQLEAGVVVDHVAVGVYVGYDDNRPMVRRRIKLAGASGALPAWIQIVQGMSQSPWIAAPGARPGADGWQRVVPEGLKAVPVDPAGGGRYDATSDAGASVWVRTADAPREPVFGEPLLRRLLRMAPRTTEAGASRPDPKRRRPFKLWGQRDTTPDADQP